MPAKKRKPAAKARKRSTVARKTASIRKPARRVRARVVRKAGAKGRPAPRIAAKRQRTLIRKEDLATVSAPISPAISVPPPKPRKVVRLSSPVPDADLPTPAQTSAHGSFSVGSRLDPDRIPGGELIRNEQFAEEDHLTNKTGDPRIGTHRRK